MVKQIQKKIMRIFYQCDSCRKNFDEKHHAEAHEINCYELQEKT